MKKIGSDVNYSKVLLNSIFQCILCGLPLLMFGCENKDCENYWKKKT